MGKGMPDYVIPDFGKLWKPRLVFLPNGWGLTIADVTPVLAEAMLARNADDQRGLKPSVVGRYAADMSSGAWVLTHQGVAFNRLGNLSDGQHRLTAIVQSGMTIPLAVWFGVGGREEMVVTDSGKVRTDLDAAAVLHLGVTAQTVATLNAMVKYGQVNGGAILAGMTRTARLAALARHEKSLKLVNEWFGAGKVARQVAPGPVRGAVGCATHHVPPKSLARFVSVLIDEAEPTPTERAARVLRHFVMTSGASTTANGREFFLKTCRAILHFVAGETPTRLNACADNPFPLPIGDE